MMMAITLKHVLQTKQDTIHPNSALQIVAPMLQILMTLKCLQVKNWITV